MTYFLAGNTGAFAVGVADSFIAAYGSSLELALTGVRLRNLSPSLPQAVQVRFPSRRCYDDATRPPPDWYVSTARLSSFVSPSVAVGVPTSKVFFDWAVAAYATPAGTPTNKAALDALALQLAKDFWQYRSQAFDQTFSGVLDLAMVGTYDEVLIDYLDDRCATRILSERDLADYPDQMTHWDTLTTPGCTNTSTPFVEMLSPKVSGGPVQFSVPVVRLGLVDGRLRAVSHGNALIPCGCTQVGQICVGVSHCDPCNPYDRHNGAGYGGVTVTLGFPGEADRVCVTPFPVAPGPPQDYVYCCFPCFHPGTYSATCVDPAGRTFVGTVTVTPPATGGTLKVFFPNSVAVQITGCDSEDIGAVVTVLVAGVAVGTSPTSGTVACFTFAVWYDVTTITARATYLGRTVDVPHVNNDPRIPCSFYTYYVTRLCVCVYMCAQPKTPYNQGLRGGVPAIGAVVTFTASPGGPAGTLTVGGAGGRADSPYACTRATTGIAPFDPIQFTAHLTGMQDASGLDSGCSGLCSFDAGNAPERSNFNGAFPCDIDSFNNLNDLTHLWKCGLSADPRGPGNVIPFFHTPLYLTTLSGYCCIGCQTGTFVPGPTNTLVLQGLTVTDPFGDVPLFPTPNQLGNCYLSGCAMRLAAQARSPDPANPGHDLVFFNVLVPVFFTVSADKGGNIVWNRALSVFTYEYTSDGLNYFPWAGKTCDDSGTAPPGAGFPDPACVNQNYDLVDSCKPVHVTSSRCWTANRTGLGQIYGFGAPVPFLVTGP